MGRTRETDGLRADFLDGKLVLVFARYSVTRIEALGGDSIIPIKLTSRFGKSEVRADHGFWSSGGESQILVATEPTENGFAAVCLTNRKLEVSSKARKASAAKVGF